MTNVVFAGVGGQGVILAERVLMEAAKNAGLDVKGSEVHGMAQRGGSVDCHVRFGEQVHSPLIKKAAADYVVSFEQLEALRALPLLAPDGLLIVNRDTIPPSSLQNAERDYPDDIEQWVKSAIARSIFVDTAEALEKAGSKRALNIVMLGVLSTCLSFTDDQWDAALTAAVREKYLEMNRQAFAAGRELSRHAV